MILKTIGHVSSPFIDKFGTPRQSQIATHTRSRLLFDKKKIVHEMLEGLEVGSYIWIIFGFHLNQQKKTLVKVHPPRLRGKKMGVLATRSPHRPNPIGLSIAKIEHISRHQIEVSGLDLVDQTPIYDIKPYLPEFDRPREKQLRWVKENPFPQLKVRLARKVLSPLTNDEERALFKKQIGQILREDPRPLAYLDKASHLYWLRYGDWDVGFQVKDSSAVIIELKKISSK
jgi:tRNA-Thr(GGU) m(6)t(6)A37 methyltransferase TsaA